MCGHSIEPHRQKYLFDNHVKQRKMKSYKLIGSFCAEYGKIHSGVLMGTTKVKEKNSASISCIRYGYKSTMQSIATRYITGTSSLEF